MVEELVRLREHINGTTKCYFFDWRQVDIEVQELLLEQLGPEGQQGVLDRTLTPFAVLGDTEESGEDLSLEAILDVQFEGVLLHDSADRVHLDDHGWLRALDLTAQHVRQSGEPV